MAPFLGDVSDGLFGELIGAKTSVPQRETKN